MENSAVDCPSSLDWEYEPIFGSNSEFPESYVVMPPEIRDQSSQEITRMACTRFGMAHAINAQNFKLSELTGCQYSEVEAIDFWIEYLRIDPSAEKNGATLQSSLEQYRKSGKITGYAKVLTIEDAKSAIRSNRLIFTGSQVGDWSKVTKEHVYAVRTDGRLVGHAFCIVGYDSVGWVAINSYGPQNGVFLIPYELTETLFTRYAITDYNDEQALLSYRKRIMDGITIEDAKKAYEMKLWNGENPDAPITRQECAAIAYRAIVSQK